MSLYNVSFTTQKLITSLDARGKVSGTRRLDTPITITALPHATAMSYSNCDNFQITPHEWETKRKLTQRGEARPSSVGNGTKGRSRRGETDFDNGSVTEAHVSSAVENAAASGDLAAALN